MELTPNEKGYVRLTVKIQIPYDTKYLKFNIWKNQDLSEFKVDDAVEVDYGKKRGFNVLNKIDKYGFQECFQCAAYISYTNSQPVECEGCLTMVPQERIDEKVNLTEFDSKQCKYGLGFRLDLDWF